MKRLLPLVFLLTFCISPVTRAFAANYEIKKVADSVYAAIALPAGKVASNAMIIVASDHVILAGAHFVPDGILELIAGIAKITPHPLRHVILTHHHRGYNYIDFDFPTDVDIIASWQTWQALKSEYREFKNPVTFFDRGLTIQRGKQTIVLSNTGPGHSDGDVIVYLPDEEVLFTSDLVFNNEVGFMGDGHMWEWVMNLEMLENIGAITVIPGVGQVTDIDGIMRFHIFIKDFLTEVLQHQERGASIAQTKKEFKLPQYQHLPGYKNYIDGNIERAYGELKGR
ncbi:MAG: beta-lactamase domain-containing [Geobacteraceae bacterium]|nr:MAG: beta-lactamase domain-containing [Geobacteraceae bacterium]